GVRRQLLGTLARLCGDGRDARSAAPERLAGLAIALLRPRPDEPFDARTTGVVAGLLTRAIRRDAGVAGRLLARPGARGPIAPTAEPDRLALERALDGLVLAAAVALLLDAEATAAPPAPAPAHPPPPPADPP